MPTFLLAIFAYAVRLLRAAGVLSEAQARTLPRPSLVQDTSDATNGAVQVVSGAGGRGPRLSAPLGATSWVELRSSADGVARLLAQGDGANVGIVLRVKGGGAVRMESEAGTPFFSLDAAGGASFAVTGQATGDLFYAPDGTTMGVIPLGGAGTVLKGVTLGGNTIPLYEAIWPISNTQYLGALRAVGTNVHAQFAGGAAIDTMVGFSSPCPSRTLQIAVGPANAAVTYVVYGFGPNGGAVKGIVSFAANSGLTSPVMDFADPLHEVAFVRITRLTSDVDPADTTDLQLGGSFGLGVYPATVFAVGIDGFVDEMATVDAMWSVITPTLAPDGIRVYTVQYSVQPT